jgi:hypothetical protein
MGNGCVDPLFLDLGTNLRRVVSFTFRPLYLWGKSLWYPLYRRLGGPYNLSGLPGLELVYKIQGVGRRLVLALTRACVQNVTIRTDVPFFFFFFFFLLFLLFLILLRIFY